MPDIDVPYFLARPASDGPHPGVVVIHERDGLSPTLLRTCQRFAEEGYAALAPDLYWRSGGANPDKFMEQLEAMQREETVADLARAVDVLRAAGAPKVGLSGFCRGGTWAFMAATSGVEVDCSVTFYGTRLLEETGEPGCPVKLFFGDGDPYIPMEQVEVLRERFPDDVVVYNGVGHRFMQDDEGNDGYDEATAADAWERQLKFLAEHLR
jgi:carboxymethylenebutenolidase